MLHSVLITGGSGYLGGSLLAQLSRTQLPAHQKIYALVRTKKQAEAVKQYGAEPLVLNLADEDAVVKSIVNAKISIIFFLVDALKFALQIPMIKALGEVKKKTGQDVHFLHTSGAKIFSEHAGFPTDREVADTNLGLYELQRTAEAPHALLKMATATNNFVIETAEYIGVRSYIFIPCIVYGEGGGFGNRISIQTTAVVKAAVKVGAVYDVNPNDATWPVCHIHDNTAVYVNLLQSILSEDNPGYGKHGYYLAASGSVAWKDIYAAIARALANRQVIKSSEVLEADDAALEKIGHALGCPTSLVRVQIGGTCTLKADRANGIGWKSEYPPEHVLEATDAEVELVLKHVKI